MRYSTKLVEKRDDMTRYEPIKKESKLELHANSSVHPIHTAVDEIDGFFEARFEADGQLDLTIQPRGQLEVKVENLKSGNPLIDKAMQGRLNTRRYASIIAAIVDVEAGKKPGTYHASGDISFHGVTNRLKGILLIKQTGERTIEISGTTKVDTRDFKVEPPKLFLLKVEPIVQITLKMVCESQD